MLLYEHPKSPKASKVQQILATILKDSLTPGAEYGSLDLQNSGWRHIMTTKADCYYLFRPPPQAHLMSGVDKDCTGGEIANHLALALKPYL